MMVGRAVVDAPFRWRNIDSALYGAADPGLSRRAIVEQYADFALQEEHDAGARLSRSQLVKPVFGLFHGEYNGKLFRKLLNDGLTDRDMPVGEVIRAALACVPDRIANAVSSSRDYVISE